MNKDKLELIDGFFNKGWACDLDEVYSAVIDTINDLQKKAELGEHYKQLYSEVKKQKDDVVEYIKDNKNKTITPYGDNEDTDYEVCLFEEDINEILRMLGEIE